MKYSYSLSTISGERLYGEVMAHDFYGAYLALMYLYKGAKIHFIEEY